jgi:myo-inositol-1(or 4)-monophosphatase
LEPDIFIELISKKRDDTYINYLLTKAVMAANEAGEILKSYYDKPLHINFKGDIDIVTEADIKSQETIQKILNNDEYDIKFIGEENCIESWEIPDEPCWIVDPLDGTTNFAHSFPWFAVSIAYYDGKELQIGIVHSPLFDETFVAVKNAGTYLNSTTIVTSSASQLKSSLLATGFPYDVQKNPQKVMAAFNDVILKARGIRRAGAAALDLAYVAAGRLDGFWEIKLKPWDTAAGVLLVKEAGGIISDFGGAPFNFKKNSILAANKNIHGQLKDILCNYNE